MRAPKIKEKATVCYWRLVYFVDYCSAFFFLFAKAKAGTIITAMNSARIGIDGNSGIMGVGDTVGVVEVVGVVGVGLAVGAAVGAVVGAVVGATVGAAVGVGVGDEPGVESEPVRA
jgi:hypothetical protein